jgi:DNA modification methylase
VGTNGGDVTPTEPERSSPDGYGLELADAHDFIKSLPDNSVDAVIQDPPYHTTQLAFDKLEVRWPELWVEIYRVCKPSAVQVMFSAQPFTTDLIYSNRKRFSHEIIWDKTVPTGFYDCNRRVLRAHENVLLFAKHPNKTTYNPQKVWSGNPRGVINRKRGREHGVSLHYGYGKDNTQIDDGWRYPTSVQRFSNSIPGSVHPTEKPLDFLTWLVKTYSNLGDTVLDLFAGSGTTAHACLLTGRKFVGCEISPEYHAIATKRLEAVAAQAPLFEVAV